MATDKSVEKLAQDKKKPARKKTGAAKRPQKKRITQAESLQRSREIVVEHEVEHLTFAAIAANREMDEKTVRECYYRYVNEIAPVIASEVPIEKAMEYMRMLEGLRQKLAEDINNEARPVRHNAIKEIRATMKEEIELRQHLGLLPHRMGDVQVLARQRWMGQVMAQALRKLGASPEMIRVLGDVWLGKIEPEEAFEVIEMPAIEAKAS